jgi:ribosomal protein S27E
MGKDKLRCPECGSGQIYFRRKTKDYACRNCPAVFVPKGGCKDGKTTAK